MGLIVDTSVLIGIERGQVEPRILEREKQELAISAVTASELLQGVHHADGARRAARQGWVERLLRLFPVLPFDLAVARTHAEMVAGMRLRGLPLPAHDLVIGATALSRGFSVVARDLRSFPQMPGLEVIEW